jgi:hypothetical protein
MTFWDKDHRHSAAWRYSLGVSFIPAFLFLAALPYMHES